MKIAKFFMAAALTVTSASAAFAQFTLPKLPYSYDALEPHIDAKTMEIHYTKHHQGYVDKLNAAVKGTKAEGKSLAQLLASVSTYPKAIRDNAGGHYNHSMFWVIMSPTETKMSGVLSTAINNSFGSLDKFKKAFADTAAGRFGSGWAWLIVQNGKLKITSTPNQDNPLMDVAAQRGTPILGLDVWEHAYYLKYQNKRPDYIKEWWPIVNWEEVSKRYAAAVAKK